MFEPETRPEGYTEEDAGDGGLADALVGISIVNEEDGSYSIQEFSFDGKESRSLNASEMFKVWIMLGIILSDDYDLSGWKKDFVDFHSEKIRGVMKTIRNFKDEN